MIMEARSLNMKSQQYMKEYKKQQTEEGQQALRVKKNLARKMGEIANAKLQVGEICPFINAKTGQVMQYFVSNVKD